MLKHHSGCVVKRLTALLLPLFLLLADAAEVPVPDRLIAACPATPNCVSSRDRDESRYIRPLSFDGSADEAWQALQSALSEEARTVFVAQSPRTLRIESTSLMFRFVDDLEFQLIPEEHIIDVRSASRVGYWDFGVNRRRVERIRERFHALMARR